MDSGQAIFDLVWSALVAGAILSGYGLLRSGTRYMQWKRLRAWHEGEIVPGSEALHTGLLANLERGGAFKETEQGGLACYIVVTEEKSLGLHLDIESGQSLRVLEGLLPSPGASVQVVVTGETGLLRFEARVLDVKAVASPVGQRLITVSRPYWLARVQRRQNVRTELSLPATFQAASSPGENAVSAPAVQPLHGTVHNLSAGGLRAELGEALGSAEAEQLLVRLAPDTVVRVRLPLPALSGSPLLARVRKSERTVQRGGLGVGIACEFLPMASYEQELLVSQLFRLGREHLKARAARSSS